jgi:hypothetical protein
MWFLRSQMNLHVSRVQPEHCPEDSQADLSQRTLRRDFDTIHNSDTVHNSEDSPRGLPQRTPPRGLPKRTLPRGSSMGSSGESRPQNCPQSLFLKIGDSSPLFISIQYLIRRTPPRGLPKRTLPRGSSMGSSGESSPQNCPKAFF